MRPFDPFARAGYVGPVPQGPGRPFVGGWVSPVAPPLRGPGAPVVGWTTPSLIYEKMRTIDRKAAELVARAQTYVDGSTAEGAAFLRALSAWDAQWTPFYQKYQTDTGKLGAVFDTDGLNRQTEQFRSDLLGLWEQYPNERQPGGQPVPKLVSPAPTPAQDPPPPSTGVWAWPWWVWLGLGAGLVGGAWWLYRRYVQVQEQKKIIQEEVLPGLIGPGLAKAAAAGDPDEPRGLKTLRDYAGGQAASLTYRPYEHPHIVTAPPPRRDPPRPAFARQYALDRARDEAYARQMEAERDPFRQKVRRDGYRDSIDADWDDGYAGDGGDDHDDEFDE